MPLIRWNPFGDDFDKMFEDMMPMSVGKRMQGFMPAADVYETKEDVVVEMSVPHIDADKVDISIKDNILHVKGSAQKKTEVEDKHYFRKEIRSGSFYRTVALPAEVIPDKASAVHEDGVLKIAIPKAPETKKKAVKVEVKKKSKKKSSKK